ncbi:MAG: hypothetical protein II054_00195 [Treponema sp.]|nr:hypothetical protein [Treponema sp.]
MNPTNVTLRFLNHEGFETFVRKFNAGKDKVTFKYFGLKDGDLLACGDGDDGLPRVDREHDSIHLTTRWPPYLLNFRMQHLGYDFEFSARSKNGEGIRGRIEKGHYYVTHLFYEDAEYEEYVDYIDPKNYGWKEKLKKLTRAKAKLKVTMQKLSGEYGIISIFLDNCIKINMAEITTALPIPSGTVIAEYKNLEEAISDGWIIDMYDAEILNDFDYK